LKNFGSRKFRKRKISEIGNSGSRKVRKWEILMIFNLLIICYDFFVNLKKILGTSFLSVQKFLVLRCQFLPNKIHLDPSLSIFLLTQKTLLSIYCFFRSKTFKKGFNEKLNCLLPKNQHFAKLNSQKSHASISPQKINQKKTPKINS
jgi:hypothetical protein